MDAIRYFAPHSHTVLSLKLLNPTWDIFMKYITVIMVFMATTTATLQITKDGLACVAVRCQQHSATTSTTNGTCELLYNDLQMTAFFNSECAESLDKWGKFFTFIIVFEALAVATVNNLSLVMNPQCSHILQQFADISKECYQYIGTPEHIHSVLNIIRETAACGNPNNIKQEPKGTDTSEATSPSDKAVKHVNLDKDVITKIKTVYHKVKRFGDEQNSGKFMRYNYWIRVLCMLCIPMMCIILNFSKVSFPSTSFKCYLSSHQGESLPIAYDYIMCSRYVASFFETIRLVFSSVLSFALLFEILYLPILLSFALRNKSIPECCRRKQTNYYFNFPLGSPSFEEYLSQRCKGDLAYLCHLLKHHNQAEYESFILFYTDGGNASCTEESVSQCGNQGTGNAESQAQKMSYVTYV